MLLLTKQIADELRCQPDEIDRHEGFQHMGLDSINSILLLDFIEKQTSVELNPMDLADHPNISSLVDFIFSQINPKGDAG